MGGGLGQHFQAQGNSFFIIRTDLKPANNMFIFFPAVNPGLALQITNGSFNGLARRLSTICKKSWQRTSNSDSRPKKDVLRYQYTPKSIILPNFSF